VPQAALAAARERSERERWAAERALAEARQTAAALRRRCEAAEAAAAAQPPASAFKAQVRSHYRLGASLSTGPLVQ
jgi:hypothetical protein